MAESGSSSSLNILHDKLLKYVIGASAFLLCAAFLAGCWKSKSSALSASQIHAITREFAAAASHAGPAGTSVWTASRASSKNPGAPDAVAVTLRGKTESGEGRAGLNKVVQALDSVATRHGLTQDSPQERNGTLRLVFRRSGTATHEIDIALRAARDTQAKQAGNGASLAIILDDLGTDRSAADAIFAIPYPLTLSILPNHPHSAEIAEEAHRRGYEVMLHLPMQAVGQEKAETQELRPGMTTEEVSALTGTLLNAVPYAVGVNNHQGSQATSDGPLMRELMPLLQERGLFYIDSRTTAATVAYDTAKEDGVRTAFRNVPFLDDVAEVGAVRKQLELAMRGAKAKGSAVAIGHPHPATLQALREILPKAEIEGIRLAFASELVR